MAELSYQLIVKFNCYMCLLSILNIPKDKEGQMLRLNEFLIHILRNSILYRWYSWEFLEGFVNLNNEVRNCGTNNF